MLTTKPKGRLRRVLVAAFDVALVLALGFTIFVAYGLVGNRWYHVVAIEGGSMEPTITRGDLIIVSPAPEKVEPGMILVMGIDGRMVTHRVVEVEADGSLVTKGDANPTKDDWQGKTIQVFGQYRFTIPALGRYLPISNASGATFNDQVSATQRIVVGSWTTSTPTQPAPPAEGIGPALGSPAPSPTDPPTPTAPPSASPSPSAVTPTPAQIATEPPAAEPTVTSDPSPSPAPTLPPG